MNRSIALFVALATLLAHVLAIHVDGEGNFAFPYEQAYTAFRLAKSLVQDGLVQWGADGGGVESYPSLVWIGIAALGERYTNHINLFCQTIAILSGLASVILLSRFHPTRIAGLIAPLLFVSCGAVAAACGSGMEGTLFVLALLAAFWFQEHEHPLLLALALALLVLTRAEGILYAGLLFALGFLPRERKLRWKHVLPFAAALLAFLASALAWKESSGTAWHPALAALFEPHAGQAADGLASLLDLVRIAPSPILLVFPLLCILRGRSSGLALRALLMTCACGTLIVLQGRSPLCFGQAFLPALPFLFLAIQEGLIDAFDTQLLVRRTGLTSLFVVLGFSVLASKTPGDLGPLHVAPWHLAWMESTGSARAGYRQPLARAGLMEEIENTDRLRAVGLFLRDKVDPSSTCLSPWPSAIAYLSHLEVADLLARANPMPASDARGSWTRRERGDVLVALNDQRDFVVPRIGWSKHPPSRLELAREWALELDVRGNEPGRIAAIEAAFANYELITVPVQAFVRGPVQPQVEAFHLLRHRRIEKRPALELQVAGGEVHVLVRDAGHEQLVDLVVRARDSAGRELWVRPTGELADHALVARSQLELFDAGQRPIELMRWTIPADIAEFEAVLRNPGATGDDSFAFASPKVSWAR